MGIYIQGMEMPTPEQGVRTVNIYADGVVTNYAEDKIATAVPVPPHGRLSDADALSIAVLNCGYYDNADEDVIWELVQDAPTIIPAEEGE